MSVFRPTGEYRTGFCEKCCKKKHVRRVHAGGYASIHAKWYTAFRCLYCSNTAYLQEVQLIEQEEEYAEGQEED